MNKYRAETDDFDKETKFIYSACILNETKTVEETGLFNNSVIIVYVPNRGVKGG